MSHQVFVYTVQPEELFDGIAPREVSSIETSAIASRLVLERGINYLLIGDMTNS